MSAIDQAYHLRDLVSKEVRSCLYVTSRFEYARAVHSASGLGHQAVLALTPQILEDLT